MSDRGSSEETSRTIEVEMRTSASRDKVWAAWTDPDRLSEWFTDDARGRARPGETFTWIFEKFGMEISYQVIDAVEGERLVLGPVPGAPPFVLDVRIEHADGQTVLRLVNSGFDAGAEWDDEYEGIESGWRMALGILKHYVERQFGKPRAGLLVMKPAVLRYDQVFPFFTESSYLRRWLTSSGSVGREGSTVRLALQEGGGLTGEVLMVTEREVALTWQEINGVLELKAFAAGPSGRMVALRVSAWDLPDDDARAIEQSLGAALDRLVAQLTS